MTAAERRIRALPIVAEWTELRALVGTLRADNCPLWDCAEYSFTAVGGQGEEISVGSAALYCLILSISLVDDLLDGDDAGPAAGWEPARVANVAVAWQAAASEIIEAAGLDARRRAACHAHLAHAALSTALGQARDREEARCEADYWRIVDGKTAPLLRASLALGAELGGADAGRVAGVARLGDALGRVLQIYDDLHDALLIDSLVDWRRPRHNLALLYALDAPHAERERFVSLLARIAQPQALAEARRIVGRCGALSYCVHHLLQLDAELRRALDALALPRADVLHELFDQHAAPVASLLSRTGLELPARGRRA